jgi:hypothetical protein
MPLRPGHDLVLRVQDDTVPGGPDATLMVGISDHVYEYLADHRGIETPKELDMALLSVQRWDQGMKRWRGLTSGERTRFDGELEMAARVFRDDDQTESDVNEF